MMKSFASLMSRSVRQLRVRVAVATPGSSRHVVATSIARPTPAAFGQRRWFGGDDVARDAPPIVYDSDLSYEEPLSLEEQARAREKDHELRLRHGALPAHADADGAAGPVADEAAYRKRLIYRSKQRGWLEVDLILGKWAAENVASLTADELIQYEQILNCATIDIFYFISDQRPVPPELQSPIMKRLQEYAFSSPLGKADPPTYAQSKHHYSN